MPTPDAARAGTLYLVGTPIGNLEDLTLRAIATLRKVRAIAAEDTRRTRALLSHLGISSKPVHLVNANTRPAALERLLELLRDGHDLALVTDAGMPSVSDPGAALVQAAANATFDVVCIPGPSAVTTAAALSGLVDGPFVFLGFLARKGKKRERALEDIVASTLPVIIFESPKRTPTTLAELANRMPERRCVLCRELTKLHEQVLRGTLAELTLRTRDVRGEVTLVLDAAPPLPSREPCDEEALDQEILELLALGNSTREVSQRLAERTGLQRKQLYSRVQAIRDHRAR